MLVACGPSQDSTDPAELTTLTQQIAQEYATTGDLARAQAGLAGLDVANPNQWLVYVAEAAAKDPSSQPELVNALIKLSEASGLRSPIFAQYAAVHGLTDVLSASGSQPAVQVAALAPQTSNNVQTSANVAAAEVAATPAEVATSTPEPTATAEVTPTAVQQAQVSATALVNLRAGPGTEYDLAGSLQAGESALILEKNQDATWWRVQLGNGQQGWVFSDLVQTNGAVDSIAIASNIPPTPTSAPIAVAQSTQPPAAQSAQPTATPAPQQNSGAPYFEVVQHRLWSKEENGGCVGQHLLRIRVVDANGAPLNGVTLKGLYTGLVLRTGDQGKGDGIIEFDLYGSGEGFMVTNDVNGAEVGSGRAEGFTTNSRDIDKARLIGAGYCSDDATCQTFYDSWGCKGHHSWEATFKRNY